MSGDQPTGGRGPTERMAWRPRSVPTGEAAEDADRRLQAEREAWSALRYTPLGTASGISSVPTGGIGPGGGTSGGAGTGFGSPAASQGYGSLAAPAGVDDAELGEQYVVRPFLLTGGRTRPAQENLRVETLIQAKFNVPVSQLRFEGRQIYEVCQQPASIADVASALRVPLGVVRVLVSDLIADGYVTLVENQALSVQMLERIRDRVRAL